MTISGPMAGDPVPISWGTLRRMRVQLLAHGNDPQTRRCRQCGIGRCESWLIAWTVLTAAGVAAGPGPVRSVDA